MKKIILWFFLCIAVFAKEISLEEIFRYASENALSLKITKIDTAIEESNIKTAESDYYPKLNVVLNHEYTKSMDGTPLISESVGGVTIPNTTGYQSSAVFQMNYDLYSFGATQKSVLAAKLSAEEKREEQCLREQRLYLQILEKYTEALKLLEEIKYKKEMLRTRKEIYHAKERLFRSGQFSKVDLGDEAITVLSLEREIKNASLLYGQNILKLSELSFMPLSREDTLLPLEDIATDHTAPSFEFTAEARTLRKKIEKKRAEIELHESRQYPSIGMYGNYYLYSSDPKVFERSIKDVRSKSWNIGLTIRFNIFNGFKDRAIARRLSLELMKLREEYADAEHRFEYETEEKMTLLNELSALKREDEALVKSGNEKKRMVKRLREHNKIDLITELNSRYEAMKHVLELQKRKIEKASTAISLKISGRGERECNQR